MSSLSDLPLLDANEVADLLGIPASTVYQLAREGRLPAVFIGRRVRFSRRLIDDRIAELFSAAVAGETPEGRTL